MSTLRLGALLCLLALAPAACGQIPLSEEAGDDGTTVEAPADEVVDSGADEAGAEVAAGEGEGEGEGQTRMASADPGAIVSADMLSEDEMARAEALALEGGALGEIASMAVDRDSLDQAGSLSALSDIGDQPSYRVLYTQRHADKYASSRKAEVAVYRYDTGELSLSTVDLATGAVETMDTPEGYPVPLVPAETAEAAALARADAEVRARLEAQGMDPDKAQANGIITVSQEEGSRCATARCVRLFFSDFDMPMPGFSVIIDMSTLELVEIEEMPGMGGGEDQ